MFGLGAPELILIVVLVLLLFGAGKLPEVGAGLGRALHDLKEGLGGGDKDEQKQDVAAPRESLPEKTVATSTTTVEHPQTAETAEQHKES